MKRASTRGRPVRPAFRQVAVARSHAPPRHPTVRLALYVLAAAAILGFLLYAPSFRGPFMFDDSGLPMYGAERERPIAAWVSGVRPGLMFSYWLNHAVFGNRPAAYHAVNLGIHLLNTSLIFLVLWRLLGWAGWALGRRRSAAVLGSMVFLVHPLQTESVSYIAGRSESLSTFFVLVAYVVFLYRRGDGIRWGAAAAVLAAFAAAVLTKEHAVSLAGILILTDLCWPVAFSTASVRRNWRLYVLMLPAAAVGAAGVFRMLARAPTAGFSVAGVTPYEYALTQARAIFAYIRLTLFPVGQSIDHDFPFSRSLFDRGAILWAILLLGLVLAAVRFRRTRPLTCFGLLFFLVALAPTSSFVPILDPLVERRMYLPIFGLILIACETIAHARFSPPAIWTAAICFGIVLCAACYQRNREWSQPSRLLMDAAMRSTNNARPYVNLVEMTVREKRCADAIPYLERADRLFPTIARVQVAWSWTLECLGRREEALGRLLAARALQPSSSTYEQIGLLYGEMGRVREAGEALQAAVNLNPTSASAHGALGLWHESLGDYDAAEAAYRKALSLRPEDPSVRLGLARLAALRSQSSTR